jgi:hypothetical protein
MIQVNRAEIPNDTEFQRLLFTAQPNGTRLIHVTCNGIGTFRVHRYHNAANAFLGIDVVASNGTIVIGSPALEQSLSLAEFDSAVGYMGEAPTVDARLDALEAEVFP